MKIKNVIILILVWIGSSYLSFAQSSLQPFETFSLGVNIQKDYNYGEFQHRWDPEIGGEIYLATNFYLGFLQTGIAYNSFTSYVPSAPDFASYQFYLQWGYEVELPLSICGYLGGRIGMTEMRFEENNIVKDKNLLSETEFSAGPVIKLKFPIYEGWNINISSYYIITFTYPRMHSLFLSSGISKSFSTPAWLKELLK